MTLRELGKKLGVPLRMRRQIPGWVCGFAGFNVSWKGYTTSAEGQGQTQAQARRNLIKAIRGKEVFINHLCDCGDRHCMNQTSYTVPKNLKP